MADKQTDKYLPKLRFPEFKDEGEWETYTLEELFEIRNGYTPSKSNLIFWEGGTIPWFRMEDIRQNGHILSDSIQHITPEAVKGTGLFPAYSIIVATTATIGEHALIIADSLANQQFTFLTKRKSHDNQIDMMYFHQYMFMIDGWCKKNTNSGGLLSVNMPAFKRLVIPLPSINEQKAISSLLLSLDEFIASSKMKLEQLKAHKKGLMQKIFPAKGKKQPQLRFKEFEKDGEWEVKKLGEITTDIYQPQTISQSQFSADGYPVYGANGIIGYYEFYNHDTDQILVTCRGSSCGTINYSVGKCWITGNAMVINLDSVQDCYDKRFFYYMLLNKDLSKLITGSGQPQIVRAPLLNLEVNITNSIYEQRRIADCFDLIDEMINQYTNKVAVLELYKKGLMQQMFPTLK